MFQNIKTKTLQGLPSTGCKDGIIDIIVKWSANGQPRECCFLDLKSMNVEKNSLFIIQ